MRALRVTMGTPDAPKARRRGTLSLCSLALLVFGPFAGSLADAEARRLERRPPPRLQVIERKASQVLLYVLNRGPRRSAVVIQRRVDEGIFRSIAKFRIHRTSSILNDNVETNAEVSYRARWRRGSVRSSWSRPLPAYAPDVPATRTLPPKTPKTCGGCPVELSESVIGATNAYRGEIGLAPLQPEPTLTCAAQRHAEQMMEIGSLSHDGWWDEIRQAGYPGHMIGQNIATSGADGAHVVNLWASSPVHRDNLLHAEWEEIGIGCVTGSDGSVWWVQNFGARGEDN